ncbi:MAG: hypothetical protein ABW133_24220 [Polyangiaceae bacterium]
MVLTPLIFAPEQPFEGLMSGGKRFRQLAVRALFVLWIPAVLIPGTYLLARHVITMPKPATSDPAIATAVLRSRSHEEQKGWLALHVLYSECGCSQRVLSKLLLRAARKDAHERIVLVGEDDGSTERKARALGYGFEKVVRDELIERYHLEAAPLLVVADPTDAIRYVGGYTDRKQGNVIHDGDIVRNLVEGREVDSLPTFGCAVSKKLKSAVDPLGLR